MTTKKDQFNEVLLKSTDVAKHLQLTFPDVRDAIMSLSLILAGLTKSAEIPLDKILTIVEAAYIDMKDFDEEDHNLH